MADTSFKSRGDGFMVAFAAAPIAIRSAIEIQRQLASSSLRPRGIPLKVRIGIHSGQAVERGGDLFGRNVALAARVADQARGGQILISATSTEPTNADRDLALTDPREVRLKGLRGTHPLLTVGW